MKNQNSDTIIKTAGVTLLGMLFVFCFMTSCSKKKQGCMNVNSINFNKDAEEDDGSCIIAGRGGKTTIVAFPRHHDVPIISKASYRDTAYVKFNTKEFPGDNPALYDLILAGKKAEDHIHITNLKPGNYYIFMAGFDPAIQERVTGGIPYSVTIPYGEADIAVPVTE